MEHIELKLYFMLYHMKSYFIFNLLIDLKQLPCHSNQSENSKIRYVRRSLSVYSNQIYYKDIDAALFE